MITAAQIRITNIIFDESQNTIAIDYIKPSKYGWRYVAINGKTGLLKNCNPIPLTADILKKAGFIDDISISLQLTKDHRLSYYDHTKEWELYDKVTFSYFPIFSPPVYLHQLQNVIYALTNTELTITL